MHKGLGDGNLSRSVAVTSLGKFGEGGQVGVVEVGRWGVAVQD